MRLPALPRPVVLVLLLMTSLGAAACSAPPEQRVDPQAVLDTAQEALEDTATARVNLGSDGLPPEGEVLISAAGQLRRIDSSFAGTLRYRAVDSIDAFQVLFTDDGFYVRPPSEEAFDPSQLEESELERFDLASSLGSIMASDGFLQRVIAQASDLELGEAGFVADQGVDIVRGQVPGELVAELLAGVDASQPVEVELAVARTSDELRQVELTGQFYGQPATYTILLTDTDAPVDIPSPPGASPSGG